MIVTPELLVTLLQIVRDSVAAVLHTVEQRHHIGMVHITRTSTTGNKFVRGIAIKGHILDFLSERQGASVLHQHHSLGSRLTRHLGMCLQVWLIRILITLIARCLLDELQDTAHVAVEVCLSEFTTLHASHDGVELSLLTWLQHVVACPHLHSTVLTSEPVGHHRALITPLVTKNRLHEVLALRGIDPVDIVIRGHHRPRLTFLDGNLEALQVDLAEGALRHIGIVAHAIGLLIVGSKMLDTGTDIVLLNTLDIGSSRLTGHNGIFTIVFEVTAAKRVTHDVQGWGQQHVGAILLHLLSHGDTHLFDQLSVPCRGKQCTDGEVRAVIGSRVTLTGSIDTESCRTISQHDGRDAERVERIGSTSGTGHQILRSANHGLIA